MGEKWYERCFSFKGEHVQCLHYPKQPTSRSVTDSTGAGSGPFGGGGCSIVRQSSLPGVGSSSYSGESRLRPLPMQTQSPAVKAAPPKQLVYWQKALVWQSLGFLIVVVLTWSDALFDLAHMILGLPHRELDMERTEVITVILLLLWMFSAYKIYLVVSRLSYLESFLHVCAWCRKIEYDNRWLSLEAHFAQKTGGQVSHGICPECSAKMTHQVRGGPASPPL